ncbi:MFS transporter [Methylobacterium sp. ID0610]|uniref:MFS transporter n=1 Tax=Methylobacterium carpenticola TaxID=3344827 RepID=UPI00369DFE68
MGEAESCVAPPAARGRRAYPLLLAAHALALLSTGLATVALSLLAFSLAGADAGVVLGNALAIKMLTYALAAPLMAAFVGRFPRRSLFVTLNLVRAAAILMLPFVTRVMDLYLIVVLFQLASAAFTPAYQATLPDLLPDEGAYLRALSLSRTISELEAVASPMLAASLLLIVDARGLFGGAALGFVLAAAVTVAAPLPSPDRRAAADLRQRVTRGWHIFLGTPRLRALIVLNLAVALASAMVAVNTVVLVQDRLGLGERETAIALTCFGTGSMVGALLMPHLLRRIADRTVMLAGAGAAGAALGIAPLILGYATLLPLWFALGLSCGLAHTPAGNLLRRSGSPGEKPALYAAQFALFNLCLAIGSAVAGRLGSAIGLLGDFLALACLVTICVAVAARAWRTPD